MKYVLFNAKGEYGHFRIPFYNNNYDTFGIIHKPAVIGMICAVIGKERNELKSIYKFLCENLYFSVVSLSNVQKTSFSLTMWNNNTGSFSKNDILKKTLGKNCSSLNSQNLQSQIPLW
jgi:CRISPR-associated Cas5-like protein